MYVNVDDLSPADRSASNLSILAANISLACGVAGYATKLVETLALVEEKQKEQWRTMTMHTFDSYGGPMDASPTDEQMAAVAETAALGLQACKIMEELSEVANRLKESRGIDA